MKKERIILHSFAKERNVLAFFYVLCKKTLRSLRSFAFFAKERCALCGKERSILLGLISRQKLDKRTEKNVVFFKRTERSERKRTGCPTLCSCKAYSAKYYSLKVCSAKYYSWKVYSATVNISRGWSTLLIT